jgi:hypothetical protein
MAFVSRVTWLVIVALTSAAASAEVGCPAGQVADAEASRGVEVSLLQSSLVMDLDLLDQPKKEPRRSPLSLLQSTVFIDLGPTESNKTEAHEVETTTVDPSEKRPPETETSSGFQWLPLLFLGILVSCCCLSWCAWKRCGGFVGSAIFVVALLVIISLSAYFLRVRAPVWDLRNVKMSNVKMPLLFIDGVYPADSSACPAGDRCGMGAAKGCTTCLNASDFNRGCNCEANPEGYAAPPGSVIPADFSACPLVDPCGLTVAKGCSQCPEGKGWVNDGCTCRITAMKRALERVKSIQDTVAGRESPMSFTMIADVDVINPNFMTALVAPSPLIILYKGSVLGSSKMTSSELMKARATKQVQVGTSVDKLTEDASGKIM